MYPSNIGQHAGVLLVLTKAYPLFTSITEWRIEIHSKASLRGLGAEATKRFEGITRQVFEQVCMGKYLFYIPEFIAGQP